MDPSEYKSREDYKQDEPNDIISSMIAKPFYMDLDSTHRNRNTNNNPLSFSIPYKYSGTKENTYRDVVLLSSPYSGSTQPIGTLAVQSIVSPTQIQLSQLDSSIDNFYTNSTLQVGEEFRTILNYIGSTRIATIDFAFDEIITVGQMYYTRHLPAFFNSRFLIDDFNTSTNAVSSLSLLSTLVSPERDFYKNAYLRFSNGGHVGDIVNITQYDPIPRNVAYTQGAAPGNVFVITGNTNGIVMINTYSSNIELTSMDIVLAPLSPTSKSITIEVIQFNVTLYSSTQQLLSNTITFPNVQVASGKYTIAFTDSSNVSPYYRLYGAKMNTYMTPSFSNLIGDDWTTGITNQINDIGENNINDPNSEFIISIPTCTIHAEIVTVGIQQITSVDSTDDVTDNIDYPYDTNSTLSNLVSNGSVSNVFSIRKVSANSITNKVFELIRKDGVIKEITFTNSRVGVQQLFDFASEIDFLGTQDVYLKTWYDQLRDNAYLASGGNYYPSIIQNGILLSDGGDNGINDFSVDLYYPSNPSPLVYQSNNGIVNWLNKCVFVSTKNISAAHNYIPIVDMLGGSVYKKSNGIGLNSSDMVDALIPGYVIGYESESSNILGEAGGESSVFYVAPAGRATEDGLIVLTDENDNILNTFTPSDYGTTIMLNTSNIFNVHLFGAGSPSSTGGGGAYVKISVSNPSVVGNYMTFYPGASNSSGVFGPGSASGLKGGQASTVILNGTMIVGIAAGGGSQSNGNTINPIYSTTSTSEMQVNTGNFPNSNSASGGGWYAGNVNEGGISYGLSLITSITPSTFKNTSNNLLLIDSTTNYMNIYNTQSSSIDCNIQKSGSNSNYTQLHLLNGRFNEIVTFNNQGILAIPNALYTTRIQ
jgi:hypothetical protein